MLWAFPYTDYKTSGKLYICLCSGNHVASIYRPQLAGPFEIIVLIRLLARSCPACLAPSCTVFAKLHYSCCDLCMLEVSFGFNVLSEPRLPAGDLGGLGVSNIRHAMNINDVVSDTVHQFAPTYHSYVLYSNSGARNAPKTVRTKEVFVMPEAPNKLHDNANLLANMELGVHSDDGQRRTMSDQDESSAQQNTHHDALYRANTFSDVDDEFRTGPLEEDEVNLHKLLCWRIDIFPCCHASSCIKDDHVKHTAFLECDSM